MYTHFTQMPVWKRSMDIAESVFKITQFLPKKEDYGLTSQIRRASVSISANIAEGFGRNGQQDKQRFYTYARGSAYETQSLILYGQKVKYFEDKLSDNLIEDLNDVIFELNKLCKSLQR
jgi:four helix bundle protein